MVNQNPVQAEIELRSIIRTFEGDLKANEIWCALALALQRSVYSRDQIYSWFGVKECNAEAVRVFRSAAISESFSFSVVAKVFEYWCAERHAIKRKDRGAYFTSPELAQYLVSETLRPMVAEASTISDVLAITVCDPSSGGGVFTLEAVKVLASRLVSISSSITEADAVQTVVARCVYAVDVDPLSIALLRSMLLALTGGGVDNGVCIEAHIRCGDSVVGVVQVATDPTIDNDSKFSWGSAFPEIFEAGGFSALVGNPPWGTVKPMAREWFSDAHPLTVGLSGIELRDYIEKLEDGQLDRWKSERSLKLLYSENLRKMSGYKFQGSGDTDFYRYFVERSAELVAPNGRVGFVVPSALQRTEGSIALREMLMAQGTFEMMFDFINVKKIFDIHSMFRFILFVWQKGSPGGVRSAAFGIHDLSAAERISVSGSSISMSKKFLHTTSLGRMSIPDLRSRTAKDLFSRMHLKHPALGDKSASIWNVSYRREFDMTNDSKYFIELDVAKNQNSELLSDGSWLHPDRGRLLPLYEGRMIHQYDSAAKRHVSGSGRSSTWSVLVPENKRVYPHYLIPCTEIERRGLSLVDRAVYCDITGHRNERTGLSSLVSGAAVCGNKVPSVVLPSLEFHYLWIAISNSFVIDWVLRRKVSTTLNYFQWAQVPFPNLDPLSERGSALVNLAGRLLDGSDTPWMRSLLLERSIIRAQIDAIIADEFALSPKDLKEIISDFPLLDRHTGHLGTETRDQFLDAYSQLQGRSDGKLSDFGFEVQHGENLLSARVRYAASQDRFGYVSGEMGVALSQSSWAEKDLCPSGPGERA